MKLINESRQKQEVHFVDGSCVCVYPGKSVTVSKKKIYPSELLRIQKFFKEVIPEKPNKPVKSVKQEEKPLEKNGGKE